MILYLLTTLGATGLTGWMMGLDPFWGEAWVEALHESLAWSVMVAAATHVLAVIWIQRRFRVDLIRSMLW